MAKGKQLATGENLVVHSTKVTQTTRSLLSDLVTVHKAADPHYSQRELIDDMLEVFLAARPELIGRVNSLRQALGQEPLDLAGGPERNPELSAAGMPQEPEPVKPTPATIQTVKYVGRAGVHIYDPTRKNLTGCSLAGHIDPATIREEAPNAVDCKKCRYCRKAVFEC